MSFCNLTHLEAHVTPLRPEDSVIDEQGQGLLTLSGNNARTVELSDKAPVCQSTPGLHPTPEEVLPFKHHSPPSSDSDVEVSGTSRQRTPTLNDSGSSSEELSQDDSTLATERNRPRTQQQDSTPPAGSHPRAQSVTWKCAVHNTVATSTNSPTSAVPPANTRFSDAKAPSSATSRRVSGTKTKEVERYVNEEGKVGVVICPNYSGGWSTFFHRSLEEARHTNDKLAVTAIKHTIEVMMFDKEVISALLEGSRPKAVDIVRIRAGDQICRIEKIWPLEIRWVDPAEEVFVHEYDGKETLCMKRDLVLWNA